MYPTKISFIISEVHQRSYLMGSNPSTSVKSITWEQQKIKKPLEKSIVPYVDSERLSHKHHQKQTPTTQNDTVTQYVTLRHDLAWPLPPDPVYESFTINDSPDSHDYQLLPISPRVRIFEVVCFFSKQLISVFCVVKTEILIKPSHYF